MKRVDLDEAVALLRAAQTGATATFMAWAFKRLPVLIAELRELREENASLKRERDHLQT